MDWILYVFKRGVHHYLVSSDNESDAWECLRQRQSCRLEIVKKEYKLIKIMSGYDSVIKL
jgi:hypothetical protein